MSFYHDTQLHEAQIETTVSHCKAASFKPFSVVHLQQEGTRQDAK